MKSSLIQLSEIDATEQVSDDNIDQIDIESSSESVDTPCPNEPTVEQEVYVKRKRRKKQEVQEVVDKQTLIRFNKEKVDLTQQSWLTQYLESIVFMYGEIKYERNNYKKGENTFEQTYQGLMKSLKRHLMYLEKGEFFDKESKCPHLAHMIWNAGRILDFYYFGLNHMKDGKDLYHQPLQHELPPVPQLDTFYETYGVVPLRYKGTDKDPTKK